MSNRIHPATWPASRSRLAGGLSRLLVLLMLVSGAGLATATTAYASEVTIDSVEFTETTIVDRELSTLSVAWNVPDTAANPVVITVPLPPELRGVEDSFPMLGPDGAESGQACQSADLVGLGVHTSQP